jgi:hypothetical protein
MIWADSTPVTTAANLTSPRATGDISERALQSVTKAIKSTWHIEV